MPWYVPPEVADAPDEAPGGFRYDAEHFYTGELPVTLIDAKPHAKGGSSNPTSIKLTLGAEAPGGQAIRWDEYLGLDMSSDFNRAQQKGFLNAFAPGYVGSDAHRRGEAVDLAQLPGRWALCTIKKEIDTYEGRPPRHKPRVQRYLSSLAEPYPVDTNKVDAVRVEIPQHGGAPRGPAPGARPAPARPATGAPPAPTGAAAPGARPAPVPSRPTPPPTQQSFVQPPPAREDDDLPY